MSAPGNALPRPCSTAEAIQRAVKHIGTGVYGLGAGGFFTEHPDDPFTVVNGVRKCDCWRYAFCYCYRTPGHRPGFNKSPAATVADDLNCDSGIEQAENPKLTDRLFEVVTTPALGDLVVFPSIRGPGGKRIRIGHVGILVALCAEWDPEVPAYDKLEAVQCQASRAPAIIRGPASAWLHRDRFQGAINPAWRTRLLRVVQ